jgi:hypothetical protein
LEEEKFKQKIIEKTALQMALPPHMQAKYAEEHAKDGMILDSSKQTLGVPDKSGDLFHRKFGFPRDTWERRWMVLKGILFYFNPPLLPLLSKERKKPPASPLALATHTTH